MRKIKRRTDKQASYQVKLAVFTGPLDLLLHLIERAEIDIYNIPIVEITDQFLAYLQTMELFDLHIAADFLLMAATLMQIKARMLLPRPLVETEEEAAEEEDPRLELVERLLEYKKAKEVASRLQEREAEARRFFPRTGGYFPDLEVAATAEPVGQVTLWDLVQAFSALLESLLPRLELEDAGRRIFNPGDDGSDYGGAGPGTPDPFQCPFFRLDFAQSSGSFLLSPA